MSILKGCCAVPLLLIQLAVAELQSKDRPIPIGIMDVGCRPDRGAYCIRDTGLVIHRRARGIRMWETEAHPVDSGDDAFTIRETDTCKNYRSNDVRILGYSPRYFENDKTFVAIIFSLRDDRRCELFILAPAPDARENLVSLSLALTEIRICSETRCDKPLLSYVPAKLRNRWFPLP